MSEQQTLAPAGAASATPTGRLTLPRTSIVIVATSEWHHLRRCLASLAGQLEPGWEIIVVDNASTDGTAAHLAARYPWVRVVASGRNRGYAGGNNLGFRHARGECLVVLNPDTVVEPGSLVALVGALAARPSAGLATPKIVLRDQPDRLNTCGTSVTPGGLTTCRGLGQPASAYAEQEVVGAVSGAAFAIRRAALAASGGFDETFFLYFEEIDLSLRAQLAGYDCLYVPAAVVRHAYDFRFSPRKCFLQERNRLLALLKVFRWRTLAVLLPALLLAEVVAWGYALTRGPAHGRAKLAGYGWLLAHWAAVRAARRATQARRRVPDRVLLARLGDTLCLARAVDPRLARPLEWLLGILFGACGRWARRVVTW